MFEVDTFENRPIAVNIRIFRTSDEERLAKENVVNFNNEIYNQGK